MPTESTSSSVESGSMTVLYEPVRSRDRPAEWGDCSAVQIVLGD